MCGGIVFSRLGTETFVSVGCCATGWRFCCFLLNRSKMLFISVPNYLLFTGFIRLPVDCNDGLQTFMPFTHGALLFDAFPELIRPPEPTIAVAIRAGDTAKLYPFKGMLFREEWRLNQ